MKETGEIIIADLSKCLIKENIYYEDDTRNEFSRVRTLDSLYSDRDYQQKVEVDQAVLQYLISYKGREKNFISSVIPMDKQNIMFHLFEKKTTAIYIDKADENNYYFDLEFLLNNQ